MKRRNIVFYLLWFIVLTLFQPTVVQWIEVLGVTPDFFLIFVISVALFKDKNEAFVCGLVFGFVFDMLVGRTIGVSALIYMYAGFITGTVKERIMSDGVIVYATIMFITALLCQSMYYVGYRIAWGDLNFGTAFIGTVLPKSVYTAVASIILYRPISKCFGLIGKRGMVNNF